MPNYNRPNREPVKPRDTGFTVLNFVGHQETCKRCDKSFYSYKIRNEDTGQIYHEETYCKRCSGVS